MSCLYCVIICYRFFFPLFLPLWEFVTKAILRMAWEKDIIRGKEQGKGMDTKWGKSEFERSKEDYTDPNRKDIK